jgi:hypothetical protein
MAMALASCPRCQGLFINYASPLGEGGYMPKNKGYRIKVLLVHRNGRGFKTLPKLCYD